MSAESHRTTSAPVDEREPEKLQRMFEIGGQTFEFVELSSAMPSTTAVLHFPGFGSDGEEYAESMYNAMERKYSTLALKGYGETYVKDSLVEAVGKAIHASGKSRTVLHGNSFGASVVYDLISDPACREFLEKNNIIGAILETPVLDRSHLKNRLRLLANPVLVKGAIRLNKIRGISESIVPANSEHAEVSEAEIQAIVSEALREKTQDRKITVPVYVVFSNDENLSDNEKILSTLQEQAEKVSFDTVPSSTESSGHHVADYYEMWRSEAEAIAQLGSEAEKPAGDKINI